MAWMDLVVMLVIVQRRCLNQDIAWGWWVLGQSGADNGAVWSGTWMKDRYCS